MYYYSTRGDLEPVSAAQAVIRGLAPDGGLYMMDRIPDFDAEKCLTLDTMGMAKMILSAVLPGIGPMEKLVEQAYRGKFETDELTPTVQVGPFSVLELFRGPTSAFKDVALSMLPQLLQAAKTAEGIQEETRILTATSGDTGKAALAGFADVPGVSICVFYPDGGVSAVQRTQMVTQPGSNVHVTAVRGNFDDAQTGVKRIFSACADGALLQDRPFRLSSANSINIGRLAPQITYYFKAYRDLLEAGKIRMGETVNFCVPTGNFGDILAGYLAGALGLPVGRLICASNANKVLTDFFRTGIYDRRRALKKTGSPSMDILVSSNLERLLYLLSDRDTALVSDLMHQLQERGFYQISESMRRKLEEHFWADWADEPTTERTIGEVWDDHRYLCDPHTAVAWHVAEQYRKATGDEAPMVVLSTASAFKFPEVVLRAVGAEPSANPFDQMEQLSGLTGWPIPGNLSGLQRLPQLHTAVIDREDMMKFALNA